MNQDLEQFLAQEMKFWPDSTVGDLSYLPWLLLVLLLFGTSVYLFYRLRLNRDSLWRSFLSHGLKRGLDPEEIKLLRLFYDSLEPGEREKVFFDRSVFYKKLFTFLSGQGVGPWKDRVELMEKLFLHPASHNKLVDLQGLYHGEVISLDLVGRHRLASVLRVHEDRALVYLRHGENPESLKGLELQLYAYRPGLGGFEARVQITSASSKNLLLVRKSDFEFRSEQHLVGEIDVPISFWPVPTGTELAEMEKEKSEDQTGAEPHIWDRPLTGHTVKISDRAMIIELDEKSNPLFSRKRDLWESVLTLPGDHSSLEMRGRLVPQPGIHYRFLFKYSDITDEQRARIFKAVSESKPNRQSI